jgi:hypothetical protein
VEPKTQATREIIARTTCGSGFKVIEYVQYIELEKEVVPDKILGCFITNIENPEALKCKAPERSSYYVPVKGSFDIHAWYSYMAVVKRLSVIHRWFIMKTYLC